VSPQGEPAFVTRDDRIYRKQNGKWRQLDGCSTGIAFAPDGTLFRRDCDFYVHKLQESNYIDTAGVWQKVGHKKAERISIDQNGNLWIRDYGSG